LRKVITPPRCLVGEPDKPDFALLRELTERPEDLLDRMGVALKMHIVEAFEDAHRPVGPMKLV
jgi:hypothetical protein